MQRLADGFARLQCSFFARGVNDDEEAHVVVDVRGLVRPGNSGGPLVDRTGAVLTTVFASTTGGGARGGYGVANATVAQILARAGRMVGAGECSAG